MPKPAREEVRQQWKENILKQRESGLSIGSWCRQNNIAVCTFRYWQDKIFPKPPFDHSAFKEILGVGKTAASRNTSGIFLEYQEICIHIDKQFDPATLKQCLKALKEMPC
jgi:hypothetical protein